MKHRARWAAIGMGALLLVYLVFSVFYATQLLRDPQLIVQAMGWALIVLPLIGVWALIAEFLFGARAERLAVALEQQGGLPEDDLPARASGRVEREAADALFARYAAETEQHPESWPHWFRLSLAYDAARDRRRARWAMRRAIMLARADGTL